MTSKEQQKSLKSENYSNEEINEIAEWMNELTLEQLFFLKNSYAAFIAMETMHMESKHVH